MADSAAAGNRGSGFGRGRGERGGRGGRGRGRGRGRGGKTEKEWVPITKLGRLVKDGRIKSINEIYLYSLSIKEYQIIDFFFPKLKDEKVKVMPVQKQTRAGQRTRFKAFVIVGDFDGYIGLGVKCSKEVRIAMEGATIAAKLALVPIRRGYWGSKLGVPHTVPCKVTGKCGSVVCRLVPAPRGTSIVAAASPKKLLQMAGITDCYTTSRGSTRKKGNFLKACFAAVSCTYSFMTPDLWQEVKYLPSPYQIHSDFLANYKQIKN